MEKFLNDFFSKNIFELIELKKDSNALIDYINNYFAGKRIKFILEETPPSKDRYFNDAYPFGIYMCLYDVADDYIEIHVDERFMKNFVSLNHFTQIRKEFLKVLLRLIVHEIDHKKRHKKSKGKYTIKNLIGNKIDYKEVLNSFEDYLSLVDEIKAHAKEFYYILKQRKLKDKDIVLILKNPEDYLKNITNEDDILYNYSQFKTTYPIVYNRFLKEMSKLVKT